MSTHQMRCRPKTAFVFAGGGSFGAVQVGMLKALTENGIEPDFVIGSSVGAINAAYYAGDPTPEGVRRLQSIWRGLDRRHVFPLSWRLLWAMASDSDCLVGASGLAALCRTHLPYDRLENARLPVHVVATDMLTGEPVVVSDGPAAEAIMASAAIPAAFAPVMRDGRHLVDGALSANTPIGLAAQLGATRLVVLSTGTTGGLKAPPRGAMAIGLHAVSLLLDRQMATELKTIDRRRVECLIVPAPSLGGGSPCDFSHTDALMAGGYEAACAWLESGGLDHWTPPRLTTLAGGVRDVSVAA